MGTEGLGGDRPVRPVAVVEDPCCIVNLVGVGGTLPDVTLCVFWLSPMADGNRGNVIGNLLVDECGTGGALCMDGANWSGDWASRGLITMSAGLFFPGPNWPARRRAKLIGGGGRWLFAGSCVG